MGSGFSMKAKSRYQFRPTIRMTTEEHEALARRARAARVSLARYLVETSLRDAPPSEQERELKEQEMLQREWAINQLVRVGNNLNQAVRRLHIMTGTVTYSRLNEALNDLSEILDSFRTTWQVKSGNGGRRK